MGNICRSPTAEGFFRRHLRDSALADALRVDSAGTHSYHLGHAPDPRAQQVAAQRGVDLSGLRARKVTERDFHDHDLVVAMDQDNLRILRQLQSASGGDARLELMMAWSPRFPDYREVPDPYYGGLGDFELMCELLDESTHGLLQALENGA
jgi:protein-tyrosine phosphatase